MQNYGEESKMTGDSSHSELTFIVTVTDEEKLIKRNANAAAALMINVEVLMNYPGGKIYLWGI